MAAKVGGLGDKNDKNVFKISAELQTWGQPYLSVLSDEVNNINYKSLWRKTHAYAPPHPDWMYVPLEKQMV